MCFCSWWAYDCGTMEVEGQDDRRRYCPSPGHHRHPARAAIVDGRPTTTATTGPPPDDGPPPELTLSIIHLGRSTRGMMGMDRTTAEDALSAVLDDLPCLSPEDARLGRMTHPHRGRIRRIRPRGGAIADGEDDGGPLPPIRDDDDDAQHRHHHHRGAVERSVMRYRLEPDRWTSLASLLLKSTAYHRSRGDLRGYYGPSSGDPALGGDGPGDPDLDDDDDDDHRGAEDGSRVMGWGGRKLLPVVDLPRTEYNRPYLPRRPNDDDGDCDCGGGGGDDDCDDGESARAADPAPPPPATAAADRRQGEGVDEDRDNSMNVSHQYPWVCMVQRRRRSGGTPPSSPRSPHGERARPGSSSSSRSGSLLGLDVVVFEARINDYSPTITEFLEPFSGSFTMWEWERISNCRRRHTPSDHRERRAAAGRSEDSRLREFYLRWSMKEAYTKALGLGMHVDFDRVEIRLYGTDLDAYPDEEEDAGRLDEEEGIWIAIERHTASSSADHRRGGEFADDERRTRHYSAIGKVKRLESATSPWDVWEFVFVPLFPDDDDDDGGGGGGVGRAGAPPRRAAAAGGGGPAACACICRGPLPRNASSGHAERCRASLEMLTLADLVRMHGCSWL